MLCYSETTSRDVLMSRRAEKILRQIEEEARRRYLPIMGPLRGGALVKLVAELKPKRILEVGTLIGYSVIFMGKELESDAEIVTIEIDKEEAEIARKNIEKAKIKPKVQVIVGDASDVIPTLQGEFDLVFLDGHKSEYLKHLKMVEKKLHRGSVVVADNAGIYAYLMRDYLDYVRNSGRYESRFIQLGEDGLEVSVKL